MIDNKIYSKEEIQKLVNKVNKIKYIGSDEYSVEMFKQISIMDIFIPYLISSYGRIFSINYAGKYHNIKQLKTNIDEITGYERITITYQKYVVTLSIHRIVAKAFIKNNDPIKKIEVNHKDSNRTNNNVENLEWVSPKYNVQYSFEKGLRKCGEEHPVSIYSNNQITKVCEMLENNYPINKICECTLVKKDTVKDILYRKSWKNISYNYDFSEYLYGQDKSDYLTHIFNINLVCELLESNFPFKYITEKTGFTGNMISNILNGRSYKDITSKYNFSKYNYGRPEDYYDRLRLACSYGEEHKYTVKEIANKSKLSYNVVRHLLSGEIYKEISKNYNL